MSIESRIKVDTDAVKKFNEEAKDWCTFCHTCNRTVCGTLSELRKHKHDKPSEPQS